MASQLRLALGVLIALLPSSSIKVALLRRVCGFEIGDGARIGVVLMLPPPRRLAMGRDASMGNFNVLYHMVDVALGDSSIIGQWNWLGGSTEFSADAGNMTLKVGRHSAITSRHYLDCSGGITVGDFCTIAGVRTTILTHQIDFRRNRQQSSSVRIEDYALVSSNVRCTPGSTVPGASLVAMGAVVRPGLARTGRLYAGVPAVDKGPIVGDHFERDRGAVAVDDT